MGPYFKARIKIGLRVIRNDVQEALDFSTTGDATKAALELIRNRIEQSLDDLAQAAEEDARAVERAEIGAMQKAAAQ